MRKPLWPRSKKTRTTPPAPEGSDFFVQLPIMPPTELEMPMSQPGACDAPKSPAGEYVAIAPMSERQRSEGIAAIADAPSRLRHAVAMLGPTELATRYRNWTVRQIAAHLLDSHTNAFIRFKLALTEEAPTIKPYEEDRWVRLSDSEACDLELLLDSFELLHRRWTHLLASLAPPDFARCYIHPANAATVRLDEALGMYVWHGRHHTAQIEWLRNRHRWGK
jgi:uncharacterized damage-inducible protein DinB